MIKICVISPHPDDAIFSIGGYLKALKKTKNELFILDVFNVQTYSIITKKSELAVSHIMQEERAAMEALQARWVTCNLEEAGLRGFNRLRDILGWTRERLVVAHEALIIREKVKVEIEATLNTLEPEIILIPLGAGGHIDHILVRECFLEIFFENKIHHQSKFYFYEELPYSINDCWLKNVLCELEKNLGKLTPLECDISETIQDKRFLMSHYKSQIKEKDIEKILNHSNRSDSNMKIERLWKLE